MSDQAGSRGSGFWADAAGGRALDRFRTLVNVVDDGIYQLDDQGRFVAVNDTIVELTGYSREELLDEYASLVLADEDVSRIQSEVHRRLTAGDSGDEPIEFTARTADGDAIPCELELHLLVEDGKFRGTMGVVRDITDRKRTEAELRQREHELQRKERRYEAVFEDPNILVGLLEPDGTVLDINQTAMEYIEADLEAVTGEPFWETPWWGEGDGIQDDVREWTERAADGEYVDFEADLTRPDGERYTLSGYFRPVTDDDGDVVSIIVSDRDVSERKRRERELERFETIYETVTDGIIVVDGDDRIQAANEALEEMTGYSRETLYDEPVSLIYPDERDETVTEAQTSLEEGRRTEAVETMIQPVDADPFPCAVHYARIPLDDGSSGRVGVIRDITVQKERERQLKESNDRLEQFAYAASHDLQEPLRMVTSYLQLLENRYGDDIDEDAEEFIAFAVDGADRMREMIDGLLEYSRVDTHGDPLEPVDLEEVFVNVHHDLQMKIEETNAEITTAELPRVRGDKSQLQQVFQNLLSNAIEYSGDEPPEIHVSAERVGDEWAVSVSDEGIGIEPEEQERVFEVFQRLHAGDHSGTGIGLALCERIVERHGGDIWVESVPGEGATFSFTLPAVREGADSRP